MEGKFKTTVRLLVHLIEEFLSGIEPSAYPDPQNYPPGFGWDMTVEDYLSNFEPSMFPIERSPYAEEAEDRELEGILDMRLQTYLFDIMQPTYPDPQNYPSEFTLYKTVRVEFEKDNHTQVTIRRIKLRMRTETSTQAHKLAQSRDYLAMIPLDLISNSPMITFDAWQVKDEVVFLEGWYANPELKFVCEIVFERLLRVVEADGPVKPSKFEENMRMSVEQASAQTVEAGHSQSHEATDANGPADASGVAQKNALLDRDGLIVEMKFGGGFTAKEIRTELTKQFPSSRSSNGVKLHVGDRTIRDVWKEHEATYPREWRA